MENGYDLITGVTNFAMSFGISLILLFVFKILFAFVTPHDEWKLIKEDKNAAAAIGFGGAVVGFALALAGAVSNSGGILDFAIWGGIALIAQLLAFAIVRFAFMPKIVKRIEDNEISAGVILASTNIAVGLLNAASMTY
ncbi:DUF350 domain-containing protein [Pseudoalteromonas sp. XMcav1-K]|uniref:DUF350 domain-containing protein n=1 Tax=Pseudoalteromonas sp. XMcav1-K TaxID=3374372 RepID=UPI003757FD7C